MHVLRPVEDFFKDPALEFLRRGEFRRDDKAVEVGFGDEGRFLLSVKRVNEGPFWTPTSTMVAYCLCRVSISQRFRDIFAAE